MSPFSCAVQKSGVALAAADPIQAPARRVPVIPTMASARSMVAFSMSGPSPCGLVGRAAGQGPIWSPPSGVSDTQESTQTRPEVKGCGPVKVDRRCYTQAVADDAYIRRIRAHLKRQAELPTLVYEAMTAGGHPWQELATLLGVRKARIYQLRAQGEREAQESR